MLRRRRTTVAMLGPQHLARVWRGHDRHWTWTAHPTRPGKWRVTYRHPHGHAHGTGTPKPQHGPYTEVRR